MVDNINPGGSRPLGPKQPNATGPINLPNALPPVPPPPRMGGDTAPLNMGGPKSSLPAPGNKATPSLGDTMSIKPINQRAMRSVAEALAGSTGGAPKPPQPGPMA